MLKNFLLLIGFLFRFLLLSFMAFLLFTFLQVLAYRWLPVPFTHMMIYQHGPKNYKEGATIQYRWVSSYQISPYVPLACIASEDQAFLSHRGFDWKAMEKAWQQNKKGKKIKGASTITQQVVKNVFLWPKRSLLRKALEAYYTLLVESLWSKARILEVYVNVAQMGPDLYGVGAAAEVYFRKPAYKLNSYESASLAVVLPNPVKYSVLQPGPYVIRRREWVQRQMRQLGGVQLVKQL